MVFFTSSLPSGATMNTVATTVASTVIYGPRFATTLLGLRVMIIVQYASKTPVLFPLLRPQCQLISCFSACGSRGGAAENDLRFGLHGSFGFKVEGFRVEGFGVEGFEL